MTSCQFVSHPHEKEPGPRAEPGSSSSHAIREEQIARPGSVGWRGNNRSGRTGCSIINQPLRSRWNRDEQE